MTAPYLLPPYADPKPVVPPTAPPQLWTSARAAVGLLLAINLVNFIDRYVLAAVLPDIEHALFAEGGDWTKFWLGSLTPAFMVTYMVLAPLFGWLGDRWPRWGIIGLAVIFWSLVSGASGLAATFTILFLTRCLVGVGEAAYGPVAPTLISDLYPVKDRGWVLSWFYAAIPLGSALGYILGGSIAASALGWRWAFYLSVAPGLLLGVLCFLMKEPARGQADGTHAAHATPTTGFAQYLPLLKNPSYVYACLGMTAATFAIGGIAVWMPYYVNKFRGAGDLASVNGIFGQILVLAGLSATMVGGWLGDRLRSRFSGSYFLVSGGGMLVGFPCFLMCLYSPFPTAWVWIAVTIFCLFLNTGPANTILANVTHPSIRATAFALNIFIIHALGDAISPAIIGGITDLTGGNMNHAFLVVSAAILVSGVLWILGARHLERDTKLVTMGVG